MHILALPPTSDQDLNSGDSVESQPIATLSLECRGLSRAKNLAFGQVLNCAVPNQHWPTDTRWSLAEHRVVATPGYSPFLSTFRLLIIFASFII